MVERKELLKLEKSLLEIDQRKTFNKLSFYAPYPKQMEFHALGALFRERLLSAGNQNGKTYCGAAETSMHLTGRYPEWWAGRRWRRPVTGWVAGVTGESTRDNPQRLLCGRIKDGWGTGMIPRECVDWNKDTTLARGVSDLFDTILVKHETDGVFDGYSQVQFKSYERGRTKWQGDTLDFLWFDEEPPQDIYAEGLTRTAATGGLTFITFTPLEGWTEVVLMFFSPDAKDEGAQYRALVQMTIDDAEHISLEERKKVIAGFLPHEREARKNGVPMLGSGKIFHTTEEDLLVDDFTVPNFWALLIGIDFGQMHPFAAVRLAFDRDSDTIYVTNCYRAKDSLIIQHAAAIKAWNGGSMTPIAWPQDGTIRREFEGELTAVAKIYRSHGLKMLHKHATHEDGSNSTEAGILKMVERMTTNRFKVFRSCGQWLEEYRTYHRKDGLIVKIRDDLMSATRQGVVQIRSAKAVLFDPNTGRGGEAAKGKLAAGLDFDIFQT